jgi:hypothetical protein
MIKGHYAWGLESKDTTYASRGVCLGVGAATSDETRF